MRHTLHNVAGVSLCLPRPARPPSFFSSYAKKNITRCGNIKIQLFYFTGGRLLALLHRLVEFRVDVMGSGLLLYRGKGKLFNFRWYLLCAPR